MKLKRVFEAQVGSAVRATEVAPAALELGGLVFVVAVAGLHSYWQHVLPGACLFTPSEAAAAAEFWEHGHQPALVVVDELFPKDYSRVFLSLSNTDYDVWLVGAPRDEAFNDPTPDRRTV